MIDKAMVSTILAIRIVNTATVIGAGYLSEAVLFDFLNPASERFLDCLFALISQSGYPS
jgi:hypothetical protein